MSKLTVILDDVKLFSQEVQSLEGSDHISGTSMLMATYEPPQRSDIDLPAGTRITIGRIVP